MSLVWRLPWHGTDLRYSFKVLIFGKTIDIKDITGIDMALSESPQCPRLTSATWRCRRWPDLFRWQCSIRLCDPRNGWGKMLNCWMRVNWPSLSIYLSLNVLWLKKKKSKNHSLVQISGMMDSFPQCLSVPSFSVFMTCLHDPWDGNGLFSELNLCWAISFYT